tara:strand:+ start:121 stop:1449 length:1329 start_codon:yes stop_codon:yes gene_type:complete
MTYTKRTEKWVDDLIEEHMKVICDEVKTSIPQVRSIVLTGGFAKGEGSTIIYPNNRQVFPVNDYDIYAITDNPIPLNTLVNLSKKITQRIGAPSFSLFSGSDHSFYVDLRCLTVDRLKHLPPLIRYFELRNTGRTIKGENLLPEIPDYKISEIPIMDGIRTLFNRMGNLVTYFSPSGIKNNEFDNKNFLIYSCHKCLSSCGTVLLLLSRNLKLSDSDNLDMIRKIYPHQFPHLHKQLPDLPSKIKLSTNFLLIPDFTEIKNPVDLWFTTRDSMGLVLQYCVSKVLDEEPCNYQNWSQFSHKVNVNLGKNYLSPFLRELIKGYIGVMPNKLITSWTSVLTTLYINFLQTYEIKNQIKCTTLKPLLSPRTPDLNLYSAIPLLLYSIDRRANIDRRMLDISTNYLSRVYPIGQETISDPKKYWEYLRDRFTLGLRLFLSSVITKT